MAWQPADGGGWRGWCGVSASPEGPHGCVLSKRSGLMSATCGTNFRGTRQPNHPPLGGKQDRCQPWGLSVSRLENERGLHMVGGKAGLAVRGLRIHSLGQALNSCMLGWGVKVRFRIPVLFFYEASTTCPASLCVFHAFSYLILTTKSQERSLRLLPRAPVFQGH